MNHLFLIGGGWRSEVFTETYSRFLQKATINGHRKISIIVAEEAGADLHTQFLRFFEAFESIGLKPDEVSEIFVSGKNPLTKEKLLAANPTGIFVCGGLTPAYFAGLCLDKTWLEYLSENNIPYCGFSAGAAIAANKAIIGGWRREIGNQILEITNENASEDLDILEMKDGLDLVQFAVDVHATQWGTLSRLIHAIDANLAETGWAIDEDTMLEIANGKISIYGRGNAYFIKKIGGRTFVEIFNSL